MNKDKQEIVNIFIELEQENKNYINNFEWKYVQQLDDEKNKSTFLHFILERLRNNDYTVSLKSTAIIIELINDNELIMVGGKETNKQLFFFISQSIYDQFDKQKSIELRDQRDKKYLIAYVFTGIVLLLQATITLFAYANLFEIDNDFKDIIFFGSIGMFIIIFTVYWIILKGIK